MGCKKVSEKLYDAGFKWITNIDFSKVVIGNMLRKHLRACHGMLWRVMDMTNMHVFNLPFLNSLFCSYDLFMTSSGFVWHWCESNSRCSDGALYGI